MTKALFAVLALSLAVPARSQDRTTVLDDLDRFLFSGTQESTLPMKVPICQTILDLKVWDHLAPTCAELHASDTKTQSIFQDYRSSKRSCRRIKELLDQLEAAPAQVQRIAADHWTDVTDAFGEVEVQFRGTTTHSGSSLNQHYSNRYGNRFANEGAGRSRDQRSRLRTDAELSQYFGNVERALHSLAENLEPPAADASKAGPKGR
jgi:hypothetical protein